MNRRSTLLAVCASIISGLTYVDNVFGQPDGRPPERPDMPPAPAWMLPTKQTTPAIHQMRGTFPRTHQVNVAPGGLDILGDAANEPSIAIDPTAPNRMVIGWRQFDTISSNFRQAGYARSNDGGRTWTPIQRLTPGQFRSDPVLESDRHGNFYYYTLPDPAGGWRCELFKSTDGGATWSPPIPANGGDRGWFTIDKTGGIGDGLIYGIWNPSFSCCGVNHFGRDPSAGTLPWPTPYAAPIAPVWGTASVGPSGELYIAGLIGANFAVLRSDNARRIDFTPTFPVAVTVNLGGQIQPPVQGNPSGASGQTWIDVNRSFGPRHGNTYAVALIDPPGDDRADVVFIRSIDGGSVWSTPVRINDDPPTLNGWQWFSTMSVAPNGRIDVTWNDSRRFQTPNITEVYYSYSLDDGATWSPNVAVTPTWDSRVGWPQQNKIGDYYDQESDNAGVSLAFAATFTGGQDVYFMRIGPEDCNRNSFRDDAEILQNPGSDCDADGILDACEIAAGAEPDANHNGRLDACELCPADWNADGALNSQDFFEYLVAFFAGSADYNGSGTTDSQDFFDYLAAFFTGCG